MKIKGLIKYFTNWLSPKSSLKIYSYLNYLFNELSDHTLLINSNKNIIKQHKQ